MKQHSWSVAAVDLAQFSGSCSEGHTHQASLPLLDEARAVALRYSRYNTAGHWLF